MSQNFKILTICIPTYNRKNLLIRLLKNIEESSLSHLNEIEVLVVDDGSTDNTKDYVQNFSFLSKLNIKYVKKENGGKFSAIRFGLDYATGKYFMNMDSDDLFPPFGINLIIEELKNLDNLITEIKYDRPIVGIVGLAYSNDKKIIGSYFPHERFISNFAKIRADYHVTGDKKEIILTNVLKKSKINFYPLEKRLPTSTFWYKLSSFSDAFFINKQFIIKNYYSTGISKKNLLKIRINSPNSSMLLYSIILELNNYSSFLFRTKASINYWRFYYHGAKRQNIVFPRKSYILIHYLLMFGGYLFHIFDKVSLRTS